MAQLEALAALDDRARRASSASTPRRNSSVSSSSIPSAITKAPVCRAKVAIAIRTARALGSVAAAATMLTVELDVLGADLAQHLQTRVAGADVVERELKPCSRRRSRR